MVHQLAQKKKIIPALKYDKDTAFGEKLPWDLLPIEAIEGMLRVLLYGQRKYTVCGDCMDATNQPTKIYPNPRLDGDPTRDTCPKCESKNIISGTNNWRKGFTWTRLLAACFRHLVSILQGEDYDIGPNGSGQPHVDHAMCMIAFFSAHQKCNYGEDDRWKPDVSKNPNEVKHTKKSLSYGKKILKKLFFLSSKS